MTKDKRIFLTDKKAIPQGGGNKFNRYYRKHIKFFSDLMGKCIPDIHLNSCVPLNIYADLHEVSLTKNRIQKIMWLATNREVTLTNSRDFSDYNFGDLKWKLPDKGSFYSVEFKLNMLEPGGISVNAKVDEKTYYLFERMIQDKFNISIGEISSAGQSA